MVVGDQQAHKREGDNVEKSYPPKHLLDGRGEGFPRIGRLSGGQANEFRPGKRKGCSDKDTAQTFESVVEGAGVAPELATNVSAIGCPSAIKNDCEESRSTCQTQCDHRARRRFAAHMNPITAVTLIMEKVNSASPYPLTPKRLMIIIATRNMVTNMALGILSVQYRMVKDAAITSIGRVMSHCRA